MFCNATLTPHNAMHKVKMEELHTAEKHECIITCENSIDSN